jgi:PIN domain nuclease of toxin-antitoxin system
MKGHYLIDTHIWIWWNGAPDRLSDQVKSEIAHAHNDIVFSVVSGWEIAIKHGLGRLKLPESPELYVPKRVAINQMRVLPISLAHSLGVARLPNHHRDPFDRMLIAQARQENLTLITADDVFLDYDVEVLGS